jgi:hypothetical protein
MFAQPHIPENDQEGDNQEQVRDGGLGVQLHVVQAKTVQDVLQEVRGVGCSTNGERKTSCIAGQVPTFSLYQ